MELILLALALLVVASLWLARRHRALWHHYLQLEQTSQHAAQRNWQENQRLRAQLKTQAAEAIQQPIKYSPATDYRQDRLDSLQQELDYSIVENAALRESILQQQSEIEYSRNLHAHVADLTRLRQSLLQRDASIETLTDRLQEMGKSLPELHPNVAQDIALRMAKSAPISSSVTSSSVTSSSAMSGSVKSRTINKKRTGLSCTTRLSTISNEANDYDDLQQINGIGPAMEKMLHQQGITTIAQIALLDQHEIEQLGANLNAFPGRIERDDWTGSARKILQQRIC